MYLLRNKIKILAFPGDICNEVDQFNFCMIEMQSTTSLTLNLIPSSNCVKKGVKIFYQLPMDLFQLLHIDRERNQWHVYTS